MTFLTDIRLPEGAATLKNSPTEIVRECVTREEGKVVALFGCNGGWDMCCLFTAQTVEAQVRICLALHTAGFVTQTRTCIEASEFDTAWTNALRHPVAAGR